MANEPAAAVHTDVEKLAVVAQSGGAVLRDLADARIVGGTGCGDERAGAIRVDPRDPALEVQRIAAGHLHAEEDVAVLVDGERRVDKHR